MGPPRKRSRTKAPSVDESKAPPNQPPVEETQPKDGSVLASTDDIRNNDSKAAVKEGVPAALKGFQGGPSNKPVSSLFSLQGNYLKTNIDVSSLIQRVLGMAHGLEKQYPQRR